MHAFALSIIFLLLALPAQADTDYQCLRQCVEKKEISSPACMEQCSYGIPPKSIIKHYNKKEFSTITPDDGSLLIKKNLPRAIVIVSKDYACQRQCLKEGMQYALCEKRCITKK